MYLYICIQHKSTKIYKANACLESVHQVKEIVKSLKIVIKAYNTLTHIIKEEDNKELDGDSYLCKQFLPKILALIALCNYKLRNYNNAYYIAKQAINSISEADNDSMFIGLNSKELYAADVLEELLFQLEFYHSINYTIDVYSINPQAINLVNFEEIVDSVSGREYVQSSTLLLELVRWLYDYQSTVDTEDLFTYPQKEQYNKILELYKFPLYYAWNLYDYGELTELLDDANYIQPLLEFITNIKEEIQILLLSLKKGNPFQIYRSSLFCIYSYTF